jgi:hypothetical protein
VHDLAAQVPGARAVEADDHIQIPDAALAAEAMLGTALRERDREQPRAPLREMRVALEERVKVGLCGSQQALKIRVVDPLHRLSLHNGIVSDQRRRSARIALMLPARADRLVASPHGGHVSLFGGDFIRQCVAIVFSKARAKQGR